MATMTDTPQPPAATLHDLAKVRIDGLCQREPGDGTALDGVLRRLFDPADGEPHTVSAFGSSL